jgi:hypothetical protein
MPRIGPDVEFESNRSPCELLLPVPTAPVVLSWLLTELEDSVPDIDVRMKRANTGIGVSGPRRTPSADASCPRTGKHRARPPKAATAQRRETIRMD